MSTQIRQNVTLEKFLSDPVPVRVGRKTDITRSRKLSLSLRPALFRVAVESTHARDPISPGAVFPAGGEAHRGETDDRSGGHNLRRERAGSDSISS